MYIQLVDYIFLTVIRMFLCPYDSTQAARNVAELALQRGYIDNQKKSMGRMVILYKYPVQDDRALLDYHLLTHL